MKKIHSLTIASKRAETRDSVRIAIDVPDALRGEYSFLAGQHLPLQIERDGKKLRRTYSICSPPGQWPLEIGVRIQPGGQFSEFADQELKPGDQIDALPPNGRFHIYTNPANENRYLAFAAGSGITPILAIISTVLSDEPNSSMTLFYSNRQQSTTMFIEDLYALKNRYPERLQLHFLFTREEQEFEISSGRLDKEKVVELIARFGPDVPATAAFVCGPDSMIGTVTDALVQEGFASESIHAERFGAPRKKRPVVAPVESGESGLATVTVTMDGHRKSFKMPRSGISIVDAAAAEGIELPYSCKGGVCATCRTFLQDGEVDMSTNYGLEPWEVEKGFILACQSAPVSDNVRLDYDKT